MPSLTSNNAFGLDISDFVIRLIKIDQAGKKFIITAQNQISLPADTFDHGEVKKPDVLTAAIKKIMATANGKKIRTNLVITALPEPKTFIKLLKIKSPSLEELTQNIVSEIEKNIPYSMDEIYFDWQIIGEFKANAFIDVLVGVAPIKTVEDHIRIIRDAGLIPLAFEIESASIVRSIIPRAGTEKAAKIIIDMGASRTSLIVYDKGTIQFTVSLPISGDDITKKISEKLNLEYAKAEKAKILCGLDDEKCKGALKTILWNSMNLLLKKIEEAIFFYEEETGQEKIIHEIILSGNGSNLIGLNTLLQERFQMPVTMANPLINVAKVVKNAKISKTSIAYATAVGLALRAFE